MLERADPRKAGLELDRGTECRQRPFGVVARGSGLAQSGRTLSGEAGEQDGALHLGTRDGRPVIDPL